MRKYISLVFILVLIFSTASAEIPVIIVNETDTEVITKMIDGVLHIRIKNGQEIAGIKKDPEVGYKYFDGCNTHTYQGNNMWFVTCVYCPDKNKSVLPLWLDDKATNQWHWDYTDNLNLPQQYITLENKWPELSIVTLPR